jgi:hypothetical protein
MAMQSFSEVKTRLPELVSGVESRSRVPDVSIVPALRSFEKAACFKRCSRSIASLRSSRSMIWGKIFADSLLSAVAVKDSM